MTREVLRIVIPNEIPPTVNHYKKPIRRKNGITTFMLTPEAEAWQMLTQIYARGRTLVPAGAKPHELDQLRYTVHVRIRFGPKQKGDGDNFWKCIADSLTKAGVIHSDARVKRWFLEIDDEQRAAGPRTEIRVALMRRPQPCQKQRRPAKLPEM